jgi:exosortase
MNGAPTPAIQPAQLWSATRTSDRLALGSIAAVIVATSIYLLPFWREFPELSHGWFAPFCAVALLWHSRAERNRAAAWPGAVAQALEWTTVLAGLVVASIAALAALAQGPLHSQTAFLAGVTASFLLLSGVLVLARAPSRWIHWNGASACAIALWWFVLPLPSGTLARFTLLLQNLITAGSVRALHLLGFPAVRHGNVIELANTLVGVEEACSGIRSFTACLFAGVVLGGFMLNGVPRRLVILFAAGVIAIVANFFRSLTLCVLAARGVEINGLWHDATAYAVLGATAVLLFGVCWLLAPQNKVGPAVAAAASTSAPAPCSLAWLHAAFLACTIAFTALVVAKTTPARGNDRPPPDLERVLVLDAAGWLRRSDQSIYAFSKALNTSTLRQETYFRADTQLTFYVAFWTAEQASLGSVALHTPDICLPGDGWATQPLPPPIGAYPLPAPRRFAFIQDDYPQYVWFWHYFDGRPVAQASGLYPWQLGSLLLRGGVSARAPQWVIRVSSNKPLASLVDEPIMREFIARLRAAGLGGNSSGK